MTTINLSKKQTTNLSKSTLSGLSVLHFGVNWGKISRGGKVEKAGFFGKLFGASDRVVMGRSESVDLDTSVTVFQGNQEMSTVCFYNLRNSFIKHSGDDRVGDESKDDNDNETITMDFNQVPNNVDKVFLYVNSFLGQTFDEIPYVCVRVYEGTVNNSSNTLATFEVANDASFKGSKTILLGYVERKGVDWEFKTIGDSLKGFSRIEETVLKIKKGYL